MLLQLFILSIFLFNDAYANGNQAGTVKLYQAKGSEFSTYLTTAETTDGFGSGELLGLIYSTPVSGTAPLIQIPWNGTVDSSIWTIYSSNIQIPDESAVPNIIGYIYTQPQNRKIPLIRSLVKYSYGGGKENHCFQYSTNTFGLYQFSALWTPVYTRWFHGIVGYIIPPPPPPATARSRYGVFF